MKKSRSCIYKQHESTQSKMVSKTFIQRIMFFLQSLKYVGAMVIEF